MLRLRNSWSLSGSRLKLNAKSSKLFDLNQYGVSCKVGGIYALAANGSELIESRGSLYFDVDLLTRWYHQFLIVSKDFKSLFPSNELVL